MSLNERLLNAGLLKAFDTAIANHDRAAFESVLRAIGLPTDQIARTWEWVWQSPYSPYNVNPPLLSEELAFDQRVAALDDSAKRAVQHLFEMSGGFGLERRSWRDCHSLAMRQLAYCPYCAFMHLGIRSVSRP
jgi:hypothetical protein